MTGLQKGLAALGVATVFAAGWTGNAALDAVAAEPTEVDVSGLDFDPLANDSVKPSRTKVGVAPQNPQIDYDGFVELAVAERDERAQRRVPLEQFLKMAAEPNTIILDTRSKDAFAAAHIKGAIHLNFSDFTESKLAKVIPDKNTRVLIYCNNNFRGEAADQSDPDTATPATANERSTSTTPPDTMRLATKMPPLALNIPTFINLRGYGYPNIYELADAVAVDDPRVTFEGSAIEKSLPQAVSLNATGG